MRRAAALGTSLALGLAAAGAARADPLYDLYQAMCVKTDAAAKASLVAAETMGWVAPPPEQVAQLTALFGADGHGEARVQLAERHILVAGQKVFPLGQIKVNVNLCMVGGVPADAPALKAQLAAFAAVPAFSDSGQATGYVFTDDAGGHGKIANLEDDKAMSALLASHKVRMAMTQTVGPLVMLAFAVPEK